MAASEGDGVRIIDKFNGVNFGMRKFKMEMILAEKDLWDVADGVRSLQVLMRISRPRRRLRGGRRRLLLSL